MRELVGEVGFQSFFSWNIHCNITLYPQCRSSDNPFQSFFSWNIHCNLAAMGLIALAVVAKFQSFFSWNIHCNAVQKTLLCQHEQEFQSFFSWNIHCNRQDCQPRQGYRSISILLFLEHSLQHSVGVKGVIMWSISILLFLEHSLQRRRWER